VCSNWQALAQALTNGPERPKNPDELHAYINDKLGLWIPRNAVCPGHQAPFDLLSDAYFEVEDDLLGLASRSGGKTLNVAVLNVLDAAHKGASIVHVGGSLAQAKRCYKHSKQLWYRDPDLENALAEPPLMGETRLKGGNTYEVLAASTTSVRGPHVSKLRMDEIEEMKDEVFEGALSIPISQDGVESQTVKTSTRHKKLGRMQAELDRVVQEGGALYTWCIFEVMQKCTEDCKVCILAEDCQGRAKESDGYISYRDAVKFRRQVDRRTWASERLCLQPSTEKNVYADFDRNVHGITQDQVPELKRLTLAFDWGYDNPSVCLLIGESAEDVVYVLEETYERHMTESAFAKEIDEKYPDIRQGYGDPAAANGRAEMKKHGISVRAPKSSVAEGIALVRQALAPAEGPPRLMVLLDKCPQFVAEMESYEQKNDIPIKQMDHGPDCARYWYFCNRKKHGTPYASGR
jgi:hypothetical protein